MIRHVIGGEYAADIEGKVIRFRQARAAYAALERVRHEETNQRNNDSSGDGCAYIRRGVGQCFNSAC